MLMTTKERMFLLKIMVTKVQWVGMDEEKSKVNVMDASMIMVSREMEMEVEKCKVNMLGMTILSNQ